MVAGSVRSRGLTFALPLCALLGAGLPVRAAEAPSSLMGWVEDSRGVPVAGAVVSLFAKGLRNGGFVAFADEAGRFALPSLPPGSYTVRAVVRGAQPTLSRRITVLPNQEFVLALSLPELAELSEAEATERRRELAWLVRHKARSALEQRGLAAWAPEAEPDLAAAEAHWVDGLGGSVEFVASTTSRYGSDVSGLPTPVGAGALRLEGRIAEGARFTVGGVLAESEDTAWRMAGEFQLDGDEGHSLRAGAGYGTRFVRPLGDAAAAGVNLESGAVGALFVEDRIALGERFAATAGLRQTYIGFVQDRNHLDPSVTLEWTATGRSRLHAAAAERTVVPGGDLLTLSTLANAPAIVYAALPSDLRAQRVVRYEVGADRSVLGTLVGLRLFDESSRDQLVNAFSGRGALRELRIFNAGRAGVRGATLDLSREFGGAIRGSFAYSFGQVRRAEGAMPVPRSGRSVLQEGSFHDLVGRVEARMQPTDTRLVAFYRFNLMREEGEDAARHARFDVQVSQGLPFIGALTRADWELLVAVRNLFYEDSDAGTLDELAVVAPPTRVIGGISVRF